MTSRMASTDCPVGWHTVTIKANAKSRIRYRDSWWVPFASLVFVDRGQRMLEETPFSSIHSRSRMGLTMLHEVIARIARFSPVWSMMV